MCSSKFVKVAEEYSGDVALSICTRYLNYSASVKTLLAMISLRP